MNSNFCTMPFNSLEISPDGTCKVCCKIQIDSRDYPFRYQSPQNLIHATVLKHQDKT